MNDDLLDVYVTILSGPCVGMRARIVDVKDHTITHRYVAEIITTVGDNIQVTYLNRNEFDVL